MRCAVNAASLPRLRYQRKRPLKGPDDGELRRFVTSRMPTTSPASPRRAGRREAPQSDSNRPGTQSAPIHEPKVSHWQEMLFVPSTDLTRAPLGHLCCLCDQSAPFLSIHLATGCQLLLPINSRTAHRGVHAPRTACPRHAPRAIAPKVHSDCNSTLSRPRTTCYI